MSMKKKTLNMRDLFVMPNFNEVATIGLNARGGLKKQELLKSVRQTAEFEVRISFLSKYLYCISLFTTVHCGHTTQTNRSKVEKLEGKGGASFDIPFMIQSHAESMKKILGALQDLPAK